MPRGSYEYYDSTKWGSILGSTGDYALTGASVGGLIGTAFGATAIGAGIGAGVGAVAGFLYGIFSGGDTAASQAEDAWNAQMDQYELQYKTDYTTTRNLYTNTQTSISENKENLSEVDSWLSNYGTYYNQQVGTQVSTGKSNYTTLAENWATSEVTAASRGQLGGSSTLISSQNKQSLVDYVGEDLMLDDNGGVYGNTISLLKSSLADELSSYSSTHDNILTALYGDGTGNNIGLIKTLEVAANNMETSKEGVYNTTSSEDTYQQWVEDNSVS